MGFNLHLFVFMFFCCCCCEFQAFIYTYLLNHRIQRGHAKLLGLSGTNSEYRVFLANHENLLNNNVTSEADSQHSINASYRSNYIYLIRDESGKSYAVCQLFDQLKTDEIYNWIDQANNRSSFLSGFSNVFFMQYILNY
jgi:hypothetical protein